jgi:hypothetical protein
MAAALAEDVSVALGEVEELEARGADGAACELARLAHQQWPASDDAALCFASVHVRTQLGAVAEDEELAQEVHAALARCCGAPALAAASGKHLAARGAPGSSASGLSASGVIASGLSEASARRSIANGLMGVLLSQVLGDVEGAVAAFSASLEHNPDNCDSLYLLAGVLDRSGEQGAAAQLYEGLLARQPEHVAGLNNFAALLIERARALHARDEALGTLGRAKALLARAQALAPGFPAFNLACLCALQLARFASGAEQARALMAECERWLREAWSTGGVPSAEALETDEDLAPARGEAWFQALLCEVKDTFVVEFCDMEVRVRMPEGRVSSGSVSVDDEAMEDTRPPAPPPADAPADTNAAGAEARAAAKDGTGWTIWNSCYVSLRFIEDQLVRGAQRDGDGDDTIEEEEVDEDKQQQQQQQQLLLPPYAQAEWWEGKRVLDLSAGLGLVGLACAKLGARVVLTDIGDKQLATLRGNAALNGFGADSVAVEPLAWGDLPALQRIVNAYGPFDLVLACDLVYIGVRDRITHLLLATLKALTEGDARTGAIPTILLSFEERTPTEERALLEALHAFSVLTPREVRPEYLRDTRPDEHEPEAMFSGLKLHEDPNVLLFELAAL